MILLSKFLAVGETYKTFKIFVVATENESEFVVSEVLGTLVSVLKRIFQEYFTYSIIMENMDLIMMVVDEMVDSGYIYNLDQTSILKSTFAPTSETSTQSKKGWSIFNN